MRSIVLLLAASLLLAACLSPSGDTSAPQTPLPSPTLGVRDTPTLIPTLIPTSTPHPDFLSLQEKIAAGGETFTLTQDGQIEMWTREEGARIVPGIQVHPDGTMTFTHDGEVYEVDTETLEIQDQIITFKSTKGRIWVFDGENWEDKTLEVRFDNELKKLNLVLEEGYVVESNELGDPLVKDKFGEVIFTGTRWNSTKIAKIVENSLKITGDCEKTPFPPSTNIMDKEFVIWGNDLYSRAMEAGVKPTVGHLIIDYPFRSIPGNCWGVSYAFPGQPYDVEHSYVFFWPDSNGEVHVARLFNPPTDK